MSGSFSSSAATATTTRTLARSTIVSNSGSCTSSSNSSVDPLFPFLYLLGEWHWKQQLHRLYKRQKGHWFTPVELFQPYYSNCIANFVATHSAVPNNNDNNGNKDKDDDMIEIVEFGGGRATNALAILNHLQRQHPDIYRRVQYCIVDGSPTLHQFQRERFQSSPHVEKISLVHQDLLHVAEGKAPLWMPSSLSSSKRSTFVIALEVLDNLPHDKIKQQQRTTTPYSSSSSRKQQHQQQHYTRKPRRTPSLLGNHRLQQCQVVSRRHGAAETSTWEEEFVPLSDPLLRRLLIENAGGRSYIPPPDTAATAGDGTAAIWVPTVAMAVLDTLIDLRPHAQILLADFDWFPSFSDLVADAAANSSSSVRHLQQETPPRRSLYAQQEPLIKSMHDEETNFEYECYLTAPVLSDILFPTDFNKLSQFVQRSWPSRSVVVHKQAAFLQHYGPDQVKQTTSWFTGYSPMIHDYSNTSVLTATLHPLPSPNRKDGNQTTPS